MPDTLPGLNSPWSGKGWKPRRLLPLFGRLVQAADLILLSAAWLGILLVARSSRSDRSFGPLLHLTGSFRPILVAILCVFTWRIILVSVGMYSPRRTRSLADYLLRCIIGLNSCTAVVALIEAVLHGSGHLWRIGELFWVLCLLGMIFVRVVLLLGSRKVGPRARSPRNLVVVGSGQRASLVMAELEAHAEWDYRLLGFVDSEPQGGFVPASMILGGIDDLERILTNLTVDECVIALPMKSQYEAVGYSIAVCQMLGIQSQYFSDSIGAGFTKPGPQPTRPKS